MDIGAYATALADDRRGNPGDDLTTSLVQAELDGERLTSAEVASFFILLVVAGNETTRNAISHGVLALSRYPEQRDDWWGNYDEVAPTAVEEIVRWASPVAYMRRTTTRDVELGGAKMAAGDKVTLWYGSANRDESKFADPWTFDVRRHPESARRVRRRRRALLPGCQSRSPRDHGRFRRTAPAAARHHRDGGTGPAALRLHPRHQAAARRLDASLAGRLLSSSGDVGAVDVVAQVTWIVENGFSAGVFKFFA